MKAGCFESNNPYLKNELLSIRLRLKVQGEKWIIYKSFIWNTWTMSAAAHDKQWTTGQQSIYTESSAQVSGRWWVMRNREQLLRLPVSENQECGTEWKWQEKIKAKEPKYTINKTSTKHESKRTNKIMQTIYLNK